MLDWWKRKQAAGAEDLCRQAEEAYRSGADEVAQRACLAALRSAPEDVRVLSLLASIAADGRHIEEGLQWARRAVRAAPHSAGAHYAMGRVWEAAGRYADAEASYREAVRLDPGNARAYNNLGCMLQLRNQLDEALRCYRKALEIDPAQPQANGNYAALVDDEAAQQLAIEGYRRRIAANPNDASAFLNLGTSYAELGKVREALENLGRAVALDPTSAEARFARSLVLLAAGQYREGWQEYESRLGIDAFGAAAARFAAPKWDGTARPGETILLHAEQGFGDTLQFVRYAQLVAERCAAVVVECQPQLKALVQDVKGVRQAVAPGEALPRFAAHAPLMSLPAIFGTTLETVPWRGPYLRPPQERVAKWRSLVASYEGAARKIGLVWAGNPNQWSDRKRSLSLATLAPLARAGECLFFSLQKDAPAAQAASPPPGMRLVDLSARLVDFADTAALVAELDLVITVDTAVAHLAGAMGAPTWVILGHVPAWQWLLSGETHPWYPSARLFRRQPGAPWDGVIDGVAQALAASR